MMQTKDDVEWVLAQKHYELEPGITRIIRITRGDDVERDPAEPVKLLEVNENTVPSGILPLQFGPSPASGIHASTTIVEVTPDEFQRILSQELSLPPGWCLGSDIPRQEAGVGG